MVFKDLLKNKRKEKGITQQELANAIFVSRSAVAKWESGLGIPGRESYEALLAYFELDEEGLPLNEDEERLGVAKKRKTKFAIEATLWVITLSAVIYIGWLTYSLQHGYGFTSDMAVGELWADEERIEKEEYVFYYGTTEGEIKVMDRVAVAKKRPIGYRRIYPDLEEDGREVLDENGELYGYLFSFKGKEKYYHLFRSTWTMYSDKPGVYVHLLPEVVIKEERIKVLNHSYFETNFEVTEFYCEGKRYIVN